MKPGDVLMTTSIRASIRSEHGTGWAEYRAAGARKLKPRDPRPAFVVLVLGITNDLDSPFDEDAALRSLGWTNTGLDLSALSDHLLVALVTWVMIEYRTPGYKDAISSAGEITAATRPLLNALLAESERRGWPVDWWEDPSCIPSIAEGGAS